VIIIFRLVINKKVQFKVESNKEMQFEVFSIVIGRSGIIHSETHADPFSTSFPITITLTKEMAPSSQLIVYYMQPSGEIVYDNIKLELEQPSENKVSNCNNNCNE
jgi:Alpha-2-macroglobulin bait region domain